MTTVLPAPSSSGEVVDLRTEAETKPAESQAPRPKRNNRKIAGAIFAGIGVLVALFLAFEFFATQLIYERSQALLRQQLQALVASQEATSTDWIPADGQPVGVLTIPRIGLSTVMVQGSTSSMTERGPGHLRGTPMPGRFGNSVILGRRSTYGAPFERLDELRPGDTVDVATGAGDFTYLVATVAVIRPGEADVTGPSNDSRLTMITSSPRYLATGRFAVTAVLKGAPAEQPVGPTVAVAPTELGLDADTGGLGGVLLWTELAAVALLGALWLKRRVSWRVAWLLGTPLVVALLWAAFRAADRFFPATL
jgi:sortase A